MKTTSLRLSSAVLICVFFGAFCAPAQAGWKDIFKKTAETAEKEIKKEVEKRLGVEEKKPAEKSQEKQTATTQETKSEKGKSAEASSAKRGKYGVVIFSPTPIDPANPPASVNHFKAGDTIYGLVTVDKPWREIFGSKAKGRSKLEMMIRMDIDGKRATLQYVTLKKDELIDGKSYLLDIAPDVDKMSNYKNPDFAWARAEKGRRIGPHGFTYWLGEQKPGKHTVRVRILDFGKNLSLGEFTIQGDDYSPYAQMHEKITQYLEGARTLPEAKMTNKKLANEMLELCRNAGWENILQINIVDKDWWIDRVSGGNSAVKSRHMDAAVAAKAEDGSCFYRVCQFHQPKLITGAWGALELTHQGQKRSIPEQNLKANVKDGKVE